MSEKNERQAYWDDVRHMGESLKDELRDKVKEGMHGEELREWLYDNLHESIDGSARVIYTWKAKMCLIYSEHEGRYFEEFGSDGAVEGDCIQWSKLAFMAFEGDVMDKLEAEGVHLNNPTPICDECGEDDDELRIFDEKADRFLCESCAAPEEEEEEEGGEAE